MTAGVSSGANLDRLEALTERAVEAGARYVQSPEMSVSFAENRETLRAESTAEAVAAAQKRLAALARAHSIFFHLGSMAVPVEGGRFANRSILFGPDGRIVGQYDKIHLFDADIAGDDAYRESATYRAGDEAVVLRLPEARLGMSICYDVRFAGLYSRMAVAGAELFAIPAAFTVPTGEAHWDVLLRARAIENGAYVVAAAQAGTHENGRNTYGHSMIIDPWGRILAESAMDGEDVIVADMDPEVVAETRQRVPSLANMRGFSLSVNHDLSS